MSTPGIVPILMMSVRWPSSRAGEKLSESILSPRVTMAH